MARTRKAEVDLREGPLYEYDESYLLCRDLRHAWVVEGFFRDSSGVRRRLHCLRCTTQRIDLWTPAGVRIKNRYKHPEGYRISGGVASEVVRQEELRRVEVFANEDEMLASLFAASGRKKR